MQTLLTDSEREALLVIGAYRDNEVEAEHGLWNLLKQVEPSGMRVSRLQVAALDLAAVQTWLAATLQTREERTAPMASRLWEKTQGNPFFLEQLLLSLHEKQLLMRNLQSGEWQWDNEAIEATPITDNVVELMAAKVRELPETTQWLLGLSACAGHTVTLAELGVLSGEPAEQVAAALAPALHAGLLLPVDGAYRDAHALAGAELGKRGTVAAGYRFLHDRVQQASYERIAEDERTQAHWQIGKRLWARYQSEGGSAPALFELVRHLNLGAAGSASPSDRVALAQLNQEAAQAAKRAGAYELMAHLLDTAERLLGTGAWEHEPLLVAEVSVERLEATYFLRAFAEVEVRAKALAARSLPANLAWAVRELQLRSCATSGQLVRGVELGLAILQELGIAAPTTEETARTECLRMVIELDRWLEANGEAAFERMPPTSNVEFILREAVRARFGYCATFGNRPLLGMWGLVSRLWEVVNRGELPPSFPLAVSGIANLWSAVFGDYRRAARWAVAGYHLALRIASPAAGECYHIMGMLSIHSQPVDRALEYFEQAVARGIELESQVAVSWGLSSVVLDRAFWRGAPIEKILSEMKEHRALMLRSGDKTGKILFEIMESFCDILTREVPPELAREQRFLHIEALAAQLTAEFHLQAGRKHLAARYLREARDAYSRWGARAVVAHLDAKYPTLLKTSV